MVMNDKNFQIALVQHPYCYKKSVGNFTILNLGSIVLIAEQPHKFYSCILCNNPRLNILYLSNISTSHSLHQVTVQLSTLPTFPPDIISQQFRTTTNSREIEITPLNRFKMHTTITTAI
jgi:hypothetical protein